MRADNRETVVTLASVVVRDGLNPSTPYPLVVYVKRSDLNNSSGSNTCVDKDSKPCNEQGGREPSVLYVAPSRYGRYPGVKERGPMGIVFACS